MVVGAVYVVFFKSSTVVPVVKRLSYDYEIYALLAVNSLPSKEIPTSFNCEIHHLLT